MTISGGLFGLQIDKTVGKVAFTPMSVILSIECFDVVAIGGFVMGRLLLRSGDGLLSVVWSCVLRVVFPLLLKSLLIWGAPVFGKSSKEANESLW